MQSTESIITAILRVFVDAIPHMPAHRKNVLLKKLMSVVGVKEYLWRLVLLYIESVVKRPKVVGEYVVEDDKVGLVF